MEQLDTPALAPTDVIAPPPIAPEVADVAAYREARRAELEGKAPVEPANAPEPPTPPVEAAPAAEPTLSKRQQEANERTRRAIEQATADLQAENARLKAQLSPTALRNDAKPSALAPTDDPEPDVNDASKYPEGQFDRQFIKDQARWEARQELRQHDANQRETQQKEQASRAIEARAAAWHARMDEVEAADPTFWDNVSPAVRSLRPFHLLREGERATAQTVIAEHIFRSQYGPQFMLHLSDDAELARLSKLPQSELLLELGEIQAGFKQPKQPPPTKQISSAPEPPTTLGRKPNGPTNDVNTAVQNGDIRAWRQTSKALR